MFYSWVKFPEFEPKEWLVEKDQQRYSHGNEHDMSHELKNLFHLKSYGSIMIFREIIFTFYCAFSIIRLYVVAISRLQMSLATSSFLSSLEWLHK